MTTEQAAVPKTKFAIVAIKPEDYPHSAGFDEIAQSLRYALRDNDYEADIMVNQIDPQARNIVLGGNLLDPGAAANLPHDTIIYNFEQLTQGGPWDTAGYRNILTSFQVWDYSTRNIDPLRSYGPRFDPIHVPVGHCPQLDRIDDAQDQDIDVLFYGSLNTRRQKIIDDLRAAGLVVVDLFGVYGAERDRFIARSKVVLNMHFYDSQIFESARVSYLLTNGKAVVSEVSDSTDLPDDLSHALIGTTYDHLVKSCSELVHDVTARKSLETAAKAAFASASYVEILHDALTQTQTNKALPVQVPRLLNIGSGKDFRNECLNLDYSDYWRPDVHADLADSGLLGKATVTERFGDVMLTTDMFDRIICNDVIEHIPDLVQAMTNCLDMLSIGGTMEISVPYDLSLGAWQDPTHLRAFNENSWLYYTDWHWYIGWTTHRFDLTKMDFNLNPIGQQMIADGHAKTELLRTPRAVDSMAVVLTKRELSEAEKQEVMMRTRRPNDLRH